MPLPFTNVSLRIDHNDLDLKILFSSEVSFLSSAVGD